MMSTAGMPARTNGMWSSSISVSSFENTARWPSRTAAAQTMSTSQGVELASRRISRSLSPIMSSSTSAFRLSSVPALRAEST
jgi:hypothetical protein